MCSALKIHLDMRVNHNRLSKNYKAQEMEEKNLSGGKVKKLLHNYLHCSFIKLYLVILC